MPKKTYARKLVAYEVVNRADPTMVDRIDINDPRGDYDGRILDGLLRQMNVQDWYVQNRYSDGSTDDDD